MYSPSATVLYVLYQEEAEVLLSARCVGQDQRLACLGNSKAKGYSKQFDVQIYEKSIMPLEEVKSSSTSSISARLPYLIQQRKPVSKKSAHEEAQDPKEVPIGPSSKLQITMSADRLQMCFETPL